MLASFFKTVFKIFIILKIYLAALGLSDGMWDLIQRSVPDQRSNLGPCVLGAESQPLDHQGVPSCLAVDFVFISPQLY